MNNDENNLIAHERQPSDFRIQLACERQFRDLPAPKVYDPNEDPEWVAAVKHTMRKDEKLMQWLVRTNFAVNREQALRMTKAEITAATARGEAALREQGNHPDTFAPKPRQKRFKISDLF